MCINSKRVITEYNTEVTKKHNPIKILITAIVKNPSQRLIIINYSC